MAHQLLRKVFPAKSFRLFTGNYHAKVLLAKNDYVMEKAFVYAMMSLTKWLGKKDITWPWVIPHWPPALPEDLCPKMPNPIGLEGPHQAPSQLPISYVV